MTLVADTGGILALYDADDKHHQPVRAVVDGYAGRIVVPLPVVAELDHLLTKYLGTRALLDFLASVEIGSFILDHLTNQDVLRSTELVDRYEDLQLGFVDASVIAVAERLRTPRILTVDLRDFRAVGRHHYGPFTLYPADAGE